MNEREREIFLLGISMGMQAGEKLNIKKVEEKTVEKKVSVKKQGKKRAVWTEELDSVIKTSSVEEAMKLTGFNKSAIYSRKANLKKKSNLANLGQ